MKLVIGGYAQGKLSYVKTDMMGKAESFNVWDGAIPSGKDRSEGMVIFNHLHLWIRECLLHGRCPEEELAAFLRSSPDSIVICDEIGGGIVPMDAFEREYRERTGRILIALAAEAEEVVRVICGLGQKIK